MKTSRAFTLLELLVVVTVIALLLSMLLPALKSVRESAKTVKCQASLRQIGLAALGYTDDWRGLMPNCKSDGTEWETRISPYAEADHNGAQSGWGNFIGRGRVFTGCLNAKATGGPNLGYAMSYVLNSPLSSSGYSYDPALGPMRNFRLINLTVPSSRYYIGERTGDQNIGGVGVVEFARHRQRTNALMCDFHVESETKAEAKLAIENPANR